MQDMWKKVKFDIAPVKSRFCASCTTVSRDGHIIQSYKIKTNSSTDSEGDDQHTKFKSVTLYPL